MNYSIGILLLALAFVHGHDSEESLARKFIVYDKKTPDVFYCPISKPTGVNGQVVKSKPLYKLCEYKGKPPAEFASDCFNDYDETKWACEEKRRIMKRLESDVTAGKH